MPILNMRTGYALEFIPVKGRVARREFVADLVPVEIEEVDELAAAVVHTNGAGVTKTETWVHDGLLYSRFEDATAATFEDIMAGKRGIALSRHLWRVRRDLLWQDLGQTDIFGAPLRNDGLIKEIVDDGRADGMAYAQRIADAFLIHKGAVYIRVEAPTVMLVEIEGGKHPGAKWSHRFLSGAGASQLSLMRSFRPDDHEGINDWIARHLPGGWDPYVEDRRGFTTTWTPEGLAAEDMLSWWTIWSVSSIFRSERVGRDWSLLSGDGRILRALADIKDIDERVGYFLPGVDEAAELATELAVAIEGLQEALRPQGTRWSNLQRYLGYLLEERRHSLTLEEAPMLSHAFAR